MVERHLIPDDPARMRPLLDELRQRADVDAVLLTGGTGITSRDQTYETVTGLLTKPLPGYGELFRMLSYAEIGAAAMLSRAVGGLMDRTVVLTMPGSPAAVRLAMDKLILPELGHLVREALNAAVSGLREARDRRPHVTWHQTVRSDGQIGDHHRRLQGAGRSHGGRPGLGRRRRAADQPPCRGGRRHGRRKSRRTTGSGPSA